MVPDSEIIGRDIRGAILVIGRTITNQAKSIGLATIILSMVGLSLSACSSTTHSSQAKSSATTTTLSVQEYPGTYGDIMFTVAKNEGFLKQEHLKIDLVPISTGPAGIAALAGGSINIAWGSYQPLLAAIAKGVKVEAISGYQVHDFFSLVVAKDVPTPNLNQGYPAVMKDIRGLTVGLSGVGSAGQYELDALLNGAGLPSTTVTYVGVGSGISQYEALKEGKVQAIYGFDPAQTLAVTQGVGKMVLDLRSGNVGPKLLSSTNGAYGEFWATPSYVASHEGIVKRFNTAMGKALAWMKVPGHRGALVRDLPSVLPLPGVSDPTHVYKELLIGTKELPGSTVSRPAMRAAEKFMVHFHLIPSPPPALSSVIWAGAPAPS